MDIRILDSISTGRHSNDLKDELTLEDLVNTKAELRDDAWEMAFLKKLPDARFRLLQETPMTGPDGWPYMLAEISQNEKSEPLVNLFSWVSEKGIGVALNASKEVPDYVLTYGMIWNFREMGSFLMSQTVESEPDETAATFDDGVVGQVLTMPESKNQNLEIEFFDTSLKNYMPDYARKVLREFFQQQGILNVNLLPVKLKGAKSFSLAFSLDSLGNPPATEHNGICEAISWFLPIDIEIILMNEQGFKNFFSL